MKTFAVIIILSFFHLLTLAQEYAIINDKDGFVNVRKNANSKSEIIGKLYSNDIFSYDSDSETNSEWISIYRQRNGNKSLDGYVYNTKVYPISNFPSLHIKKTGNNVFSLTNDSISVTVQSSKFNSKNHKLSFENDQTHIDGKLIWGTDREVPRAKISSVKVVICNKSVSIPYSSFNDLYEPNFRNLNVYLSKNGVLYIVMENSDGAGAYTVIWIIKNRKYFCRYIDNSMV